MTGGPFSKILGYICEKNEDPFLCEVYVLAHSVKDNVYGDDWQNGMRLLAVSGNWLAKFAHWALPVWELWDLYEDIPVFLFKVY